VCGVTSTLVTYQRVEPGASSASTVPGSPRGTPPAPYRAQVPVVVDPQHALGFYAALSDLRGHLDVFGEFLASVSFPSKQCTG
jgi:hypothetical protein